MFSNIWSAVPWNIILWSYYPRCYRATTISHCLCRESLLIQWCWGPSLCSFLYNIGEWDLLGKIAGILSDLTSYIHFSLSTSLSLSISSSLPTWKFFYIHCPLHGPLLSPLFQKPSNRMLVLYSRVFFGYEIFNQKGCFDTDKLFSSIFIFSHSLSSLLRTL